MFRRELPRIFAEKPAKDGHAVMKKSRNSRQTLSGFQSRPGRMGQSTDIAQHSSCTSKWRVPTVSDYKNCGSEVVMDRIKFAIMGLMRYASCDFLRRGSVRH